VIRKREGGVSKISRSIKGLREGGKKSDYVINVIE
jgi:hypothetical protein